MRKIARRLNQATALLLLLSFTFSSFFSNSTFAQEPASTPEQNAESLQSQSSSGGQLSLLGDPDTDVFQPINVSSQGVSIFDGDLSTGAFVYGYPFSLPPGRNGLTPKLALSYNSNERNNDSFVGYGWSFDIPSITRVNRHGSDVLYNYDDFQSSLSGELVKVSTTTYRAKIEDGSFLSYTFSNNAWTILDKSGTRYLFGLNATSRQDDVASTTRVYKWMLEEVRDTNNNFIRYEYYKDQGQIYPSNIFYTGNGIADGIFKVVFNRSAVNMSPDMYFADFKVRTDYRISSVELQENTQWVRRYDFAYTTGDNARRPLLSSVTENGRDLLSGATIAKPATVFSYQQRGGDIEWTKTTGGDFELPYWFADQGIPTHIKVQDVNGDAYPDVIYSPHTTSEQKVYINDANGGWNLASYPNEWVIPDNFILSNGNPNGIEMFDYDGDQINDLVGSTGTNEGPASSGGKRGFASTTYAFATTTSVQVPVGFVSLTPPGDNGARVVDFNGDGLLDIVYGWLDDDEGPNLVFHENTWRGNGSGWATTSTSTWSLPWGIVDENLEGKNVFTFAQFVDLNGDGLTDYMFQMDGNPKPNAIVGINNGHTWTIFNPPGGGGDWSGIPITQEDDEQSNGWTDAGMRAWDMNGDGIVDITGGQGLMRLDEDDPFNGVQPEMPLNFTDSQFRTLYTGLADINADGMMDFLRAEKTATSTEYQTYLSNNSPFTDLLTGIQSAEGASTTVAYKMSTQYKNQGGALLNPSLPIAVVTLESITTDDGFGNTMTDSYTYADGSYYFNSSFDRGFAGFGLITKADMAGNITKTYLHQGNGTATSTGEYSDHVSKRGKPYRTEQYNDSSNLYSKTINKWDRFDLGSGASLVKLVQTVDSSYDGDADRKDKAESYTYNNSAGTLTQKVEWGEVTGSDDGTFSDTGTDKFTTNFTYATSTATSTTQFLSQEVTVNQSASKVREKKLYYDGLSFGQLTKANPTKDERWKTSSSYASTTQTFTSYGLVATSTDARSKSTGYKYDSFNLFVATTTNPVGHITHFLYDYSSGKVATTTDPNGRVFATVYDGLDRPLAEKQPDIVSPTTLVTKKTYTYTDTVGSRKVVQTSYLDGAVNFVLYTYLDGLSRTMQTRKEAEGTYAVRDFAYDNRGLLQKESLPYFSSGTAQTTATTNNALYTTYAYDPFKRISSATNVVGATSNVYDQWTTYTTDAQGNIKDYSSDAFGNLTQVVEHNGSNYTTAYQYDGNKNLTKITDADGNVRNFTYDGVGRRLTAQDIHDAADGTYGTWTYVYDDAGNVTSQVDPKSQTVNFTYDNVSRVLTEDYTGQSGTEVSYGYDTCAEGKGRFCSATTTQAITNFAYNALGLPASETKKLNNVNYTTSYAYDRQGNLTTLTYPDNAQARYTYNTAGLLGRVEQKESGGSFLDVVSNFDYAPTERVTFKEFGNSINSTYTYDANELYRLKNILTVVSEAQLWGGGGESFAEDPYANLALFSSPYQPVFADLLLDPSLFTDASTTEPISAPPDPTPILPTTTSTPPVELPVEVASTTDTTTLPPLEENPIIIPTPETPATTTEQTLASSTPPLLDILLVPEFASTTKVSIREMLLDKSASERADIKGQEIAKLNHVGEFVAKDGYRIEIISLEQIEGGVQVFARAWNKEQQLGFGADGTVEIERFRIFNPPVMVPDDTGDYERKWTDERGEHVLRFREDPKEAIRQVVAHAVQLVGKEGAKIELGKIGNTTDTFYPSLDGYTREDNASSGVSWATIRGATVGDGADDTSANLRVSLRGALGVSNQWREQARSILAFNTSAIPDTDTVSSGTLSVYDSVTSQNPSEYGLSVVVDRTTAGSSITTSDYNVADWATTLQSDTTIPFTSFSNTGTYKDFTLNATGRGNISATSTTWFGLRQSADFNNVEPSWSSNVESDVVPSSADVTGTTQDPKLVVVHSSANSAPTAPTSLLTEGLTNPTNIDDYTPEFSAIYNDPDTSDVATKYRIQLATSTVFASPLFDTGTTTLASSTPQGTRIADISYAGSMLTASTTYYWRIKFWDFADIEGAWSTATSSFSISTTTPLPPPTAIQNISFTYDAVGNITNSTDLSDTGAGKTLALSYDTLYRLTTASTTVASSTPFRETYAYSPLGNITGLKQNTTATTTYSYAETGSTNPHAPTNVGGVGLKYDTNGNLTNYGVKSYTWDWRNRMATSSSGTASTTYAYDHTSERVKKTVGSVTTLYANDYWNKQGTGAGATTTRQIYGNGEVIATVEGNGTATSTNYAHGDQLGSVGVSTDGNGNVTEATDYYPYGAERVATGSYSGQRKYIGEVYDEESSMSYLNARYYQNTRGQFISQDPVFWEIGLTSDGKKVLQSPQAQNSYSYAGNNPLTNKDPTGRDYLEVTGSLDIQPISGNIGARFDFKNGRIDISYGGGFATGLSTSLTGFYSTDDLPTANNYITESGDVTFSPFGLAAKVGGSNTQTIENPSKSKLNLGVTPGVAVGIGEGYSRSATVNYNFTFIDVRNQRGFLFQIQKDLNKISKSLQQIGKIFRQSVNNKNNNKKSP